MERGAPPLRRSASMDKLLACSTSDAVA